MVALNENFAPEKTAPRSKNRVGNFFSGTPDCVGSDRLATRNRIGEKRSCSYDIASGVTYYGFRYYDPETGRWPSRDPIGEQGHRMMSKPAWTIFAKAQLELMLMGAEAKITNLINFSNGAHYESARDAFSDWVKIVFAIREYSSLARAWNYVDYRTYYRGARGSHFSSNSYFDDLGANGYLFSANNSVMFVDVLGLLVEVQSRTVVVGTGAHTWVRVTDSEGNETTGSGYRGEDGELIVEQDYDPDLNADPDDITSTEEIPPPDGMTQEEWDQAVRDSIAEQCERSGDRDYALFGGDGDTSGNCHCVTSDIIEGAGGEIPSGYNPPRANPGLRTADPAPRRGRRN